MSNYFKSDKKVKENFFNIKLKSTGKWKLFILGVRDILKSLGQEDEYMLKGITIYPSLLIRELILSDCSFEN